MQSENNASNESLLSTVKPSVAIVKLAVPATLALLAKAVYNIVDTAYIGMLHDDIALTAVGVTVPLLLIMVSIENIFAAGAAVLAGRQLGGKDPDGASRTVTSIIGISIIIGIVLCIGGILLIEPIMRAFGASDASLPQAKQYAFWMFVAALANLPAQSMNCAARAESSVKITSIAVITGAALNVVLDPVFMFDWGLGMAVEGASLATIFHHGLVLSQRPLYHQTEPQSLPSHLEPYQNGDDHRCAYCRHSNLPGCGLLLNQCCRQYIARFG